MFWDTVVVLVPILDNVAKVYERKVLCGYFVMITLPFSHGYTKITFRAVTQTSQSLVKCVKFYLCVYE